MKEDNIVFLWIAKKEKEKKLKRKLITLKMKNKINSMKKKKLTTKRMNEEITERDQDA
jgi:hypothetical protein